jgi:hypothetical protein
MTTLGYALVAMLYCIALSPFIAMGVRAFRAHLIPRVTRVSAGLGRS